MVAHLILKAQALASLSLPFLVTGLGAQAWASRFPPNPECRLPVPTPTGAAAPTTATLIIRATAFGSDEGLPNLIVGVAPLGEPNSATGIPAWTPDTSRVHRVEGMNPGRYSLVVRGLGFLGRTDTITVVAGNTYTLRVPLETWEDGYRNLNNCRPRGFRREGELACLTSGPEVERALDYAHHVSQPEQIAAFELPAVDTTRIDLVRDENTCERAGRLYGDLSDPPRMVVVVRMDTLYLVFDPFEPKWAGEWDLHVVFDSHWNRLVSLAS
jgi:hypothetical protein